MTRMRLAALYLAGRPFARFGSACGPTSQLVIRHLENLLQHFHIARLEALFEPVNAWADVPCVKFSGETKPVGAALQSVVADGVGGFDRGFDVARLDEVELFLAVMGPHARQIVGLQLQADRPRVEFLSS